MQLYDILTPTAPAVPIVISSPHSGTFFPEHIRSRLKPELAAAPDDTDWFIHRLYDFAPAMGITLIRANYSRWVIDLNRDPQQKPLYDDGRVITGLVPLTDFNGLPLYRENPPQDAEVEQRLEAYFLPYHRQIGELLEQTRQRFGKALLFDAHSIRKVVPGIRQQAFPDLILGDNDQTSASPAITAAAFTALKKGTYGLEHNQPFKGGFITRSFGKPEENVHALQLEMAKTNYMDDTETQYDDARAGKMRDLLQAMFANLIDTLK